jgi:hypothetical protein
MVGLNKLTCVIPWYTVSNNWVLVSLLVFLTLSSNFVSGPSYYSFENNVVSAMLSKIVQLFLQGSVRGTTVSHAVSECSLEDLLVSSFSLVLLKLSGL